MCLFRDLGLKSKFFKYLSLFLVLYLFNVSWLRANTYHGNAIYLAYIFSVLLFSVSIALIFTFILEDEFSLINALAVASLVALTEWSRLFYFSGFPFAVLGTILDFHPYFTQTASVFGVFFLTFVWVFFSYLLSFRRVQSAAILSLTLFVFGFLRIYNLENSEQKTNLNVALVQTGFLVEEKWRFDNQLDKYINPTKQWQTIFKLLENEKKESFDLIVLPEVALSGSADNEKLVEDKGSTCSHLDMARRLSNKYQSDVLIGLIHEDLDQAHNSAFFLQKNSEVIERYDKQVLVPMSEYLPVKFFSSFLEKYGIKSFFSKGDTYKLMKSKKLFSPSICYEEGFNDLIRKARLNGAKFFVNLTNDAWFPNSILNEEHNILGKMRAVENGVFVFRTCNNGITSVIDPFGREIKRLKDKDHNEGFFKAVLSLDVGVFDLQTLFSRFGNMPILFLSSLNLILNFLIKRKSFSRVLSSFSKASRS